ncbi:cadherin EGF LAG seven-pass G-type receptor 1-like [Macaca thibetana thibetana]|uniref:cadherin EGF LAG seven-pass G-type receptor 1-like n=1 Tax=Macaca thibetana thibetana TaxID=257877 RepID=UPI0021BCCF1D|nr:cadherin EGF LAG seven-pass G-type receptor 1-like [Macaca thibetana thibetana]
MICLLLVERPLHVFVKRCSPVPPVCWACGVAQGAAELSGPLPEPDAADHHLHAVRAELHDNMCLCEPCENYMKGVCLPHFDSSVPFLSSTTVLFWLIYPISGLRCWCLPSFTGDFCETEIDLCYSNLCSANGRCHSCKGGYT